MFFEVALDGLEALPKELLTFAEGVVIELVVSENASRDGELVLHGGAQVLHGGGAHAHARRVSLLIGERGGVAVQRDAHSILVMIDGGYDE